jgi:hypothetical protein
LGFLQNAKAQFTYYRDELARLANEMTQQIENRHLVAIRNVWDEVRDFDENCIRFKNGVVLRTEGTAKHILIGIYSETRDWNNLFFDLINTLPRIELLRSNPNDLEVLSLKPELYGISLDLKLLFKKAHLWLRSLYSKPKI